VEVKSAFASGSAFAQHTDGVIGSGVVADNVEPWLNRCRALPIENFRAAAKGMKVEIVSAALSAAA
jgi:hypothetical protein